MLYSIFTTMPTFVCGFWTLLLCLQIKEGNKAKKILTIFMATATVLYFSHCAYFNKEYAIIPITDTFYSLANMAVYPLYFLYIQALTKHDSVRSRNLLVLLPSIITATAIAILYILMDSQECDNFIQGYLYEHQHESCSLLEDLQQKAHLLAKTIFGVQLIPILWIGSKKISDYNKQVLSFYSDTEGKTIFPMKWLLISFALTTLVSLVVNVIGRAYFADSIYLLVIPSSLFSALLFIIGLIGYKQQISANELQCEFDMERQDDNDSTENDNKYGIKLKEQIKHLIEEEKLYLHPNLKISDLATRLKTNRNYIYNAINVEMKMSFSEYINCYRIAHAKQLMTENPEINILDLYMQSGFSSEISFYRNFKLFTGETPNQWIKKQDKTITQE